MGDLGGLEPLSRDESGLRWDERGGNRVELAGDLRGGDAHGCRRRDVRGLVSVGEFGSFA